MQSRLLSRSRTLLIHSRRKYFSSEERLAIAQQAAAEKRQRQPSKKSTSSTSSGKSSVFDVIPKRRKCSSRQRRSSLPTLWNAQESDKSTDPSWFEDLPDKVKRLQSNKQELAAVDASKAEPERPRTSSATKPTFEPVTWGATARLKQKVSFHSPSISISPSTCSNQTSHSAPPYTSASHSAMSVSVASDSYSSRSTPASPAVPALTITRPREISQMKRPSLRRPYLHPIPLPPPILAPEPSLPSPDTSTYLDMMKTFGTGPILVGKVNDEETTPTQEREDARLDVTSVPPAWYDEKLNFDFDEYHKPSLSTNASSEQPRTNSPSVSDAASFDTSGPLTPSSPAALPHTFDQPMGKMPPLPRPSSSSVAQESTPNNSSVTNFSHPQHLTQRDSSPRLKPMRPGHSGHRHLVDGFYEHQQNQPYSIMIHYNKHDPLALEALPVCDDLTGAHGAFAVSDEQHNKGFRKVLRVIRGH